MVAVLWMVIVFFSPASGILFYRNSHNCTVCHHGKTWSDCHYEMCRSNQKCHMKVKLHDHGYEIDAGCVSECPDHHSHYICDTCCSTDNCNYQHCQAKVHMVQSQVTHAVKLCRKCSPHGISWTCDAIERCNGDHVQACYIQKVEHDLRPVYTSGCIEQKHCSRVETHEYHDEQERRRSEHLEKGKCCYHDSCNDLSLLTPTVTTRKPTTHPHPHPSVSHTAAVKQALHGLLSQVNQGVQYCRVCTTASCLLEKCPQTQRQACYVIEGSKNGLTMEYKSGCIDQQSCVKIESRYLLATHYGKGKCCYTNACNDISILTPQALTAAPTVATTTSTTAAPNPTTKSPTASTTEATTTSTTSTTTTTPTSTPTTTPTTTTPTSTAPPTTTPALTTVMTTTTTATTTSTTAQAPTKTSTSPPTTRSNKGNVCEVCADEYCNNIIPYQCPDLYPLCLSSVKNENGDVTYEKRCASFTECAKRWVIESSVKSECSNLGQNTTFSPGLDCTFCCDADSCNKDTVPPRETLSYKIR